jgi:hypothetical protein
MKIKPNELTENGYVLLDRLGHKELVPFIRTYIKKWTKYTVFYYLSNLIVFGLAGYLFLDGYNVPDYNFGDRFTHFAYGLAIAFLLVPLHEYICVSSPKNSMF